MRSCDLLRRLALAFGLASTCAAHGAELSGKVISVGDGRGIAQAMVTLSFPDGHQGPAAITVFSGPDGSFRIASDSLPSPDKLNLHASSPGFRQVEPADGVPRPDPRLAPSGPS